MLHGELSEVHGKPELQYMIAGDAHGKGFATEFASAVLRQAASDQISESVIATVDIPNIGSLKVLEKLGASITMLAAGDLFLALEGRW